jgi:hypothetical protein
MQRLHLLNHLPMPKEEAGKKVKAPTKPFLKTVTKSKIDRDSTDEDSWGSATLTTNDQDLNVKPSAVLGKEKAT